MQITNDEALTLYLLIFILVLPFLPVYERFIADISSRLEALAEEFRRTDAFWR